MSEKEMCYCGVPKEMSISLHFHNKCPNCGNVMANGNNFCSLGCYNKYISEEVVK